MKNRLKELRLKSGLSQAQLAQKTKISNQAISFYENNKRKPKLETWEKLAKYFDVTIDYIQGFKQFYAECRWCGNKFVLTDQNDKDRYFYCPYCGRSPLTFKTK